MDTNTRKTIDELLARLRAGDRSVIDQIVEVYNSRPVERRSEPRGAGVTRVQGWKVVQL